MDAKMNDSNAAPAAGMERTAMETDAGVEEHQSQEAPEEAENDDDSTTQQTIAVDKDNAPSKQPGAVEVHSPQASKQIKKDAMRTAVKEKVAQDCAVEPGEAFNQVTDVKQQRADRLSNSFDPQTEEDTTLDGKQRWFDRGLGSATSRQVSVNPGLLTSASQASPTDHAANANNISFGLSEPVTEDEPAPGAIAVEGITGTTINSPFGLSEQVTEDEPAPGAIAVVRITGTTMDEQSIMVGGDTLGTDPETNIRDTSGTVLEATMVDEEAVEADLEKRLQERMAKEKTRIAKADVLTMPWYRRGWCWVPLVLVLVTIVVGVSVGVTRNRESTVGVQPTGSPTLSPTFSPTSSECQFCADGNVPDGLSDIIIQQVPSLRTCGDLLDETAELKIFEDQCQVNQAAAALRCGCASFPPIPADSACSLCGDGFIPASRDSTANPAICNDFDRWLQIAGSNANEEECEAMRNENVECRCRPVVQDNDEEECFTQIAAIISREDQVQDISQSRTYVLCPNTVFNMGTLDVARRGIFGGDLPIHVRSNARVICGVDARKENNCILKGGSMSFLSLPGLIYDELEYDNLWFQGITVQDSADPNGASVSFVSPTNATFVDCVFANNVNKTIFYHRNYELPYNPAVVGDVASKDRVTSKTTFDGCLFLNNTGNSSTLTDVLLVINPTSRETSPNPDALYQTSLEVRRSFISKNSVYATAIGTFDKGSLVLVDNCIEENSFQRDFGRHHQYGNSELMQSENWFFSNIFVNPSSCFEGSANGIAVLSGNETTCVYISQGFGPCQVAFGF